MSRGSPTLPLLAGLAFTLIAVSVYSYYAITQIQGLRLLQEESIDRNRADALLLLRIQNDINSLGLSMRDMLDRNEPYSLTAWRGQLKRIRIDLEDALRRQTASPDNQDPQHNALKNDLAQFWDALDRVFGLSEQRREAEALTQIRLSLQARQSTLTTIVARLLVKNNEKQQEAAARTREIYSRVERDVYLFLAVMLVLIAGSGLYLVYYNRRLFQEVAQLSARRSDLAQQLISFQENTFQSIARELHDEFGQILTAIGLMLQRARRQSGGTPQQLPEDLDEVRELVQSTLDKVRSFSQVLHPAVLEDAGFQGALESYLAGFEKRTGLRLRYECSGTPRDVDPRVAIHVYRVLQESLNNVVRHAQSSEATVNLVYAPRSLILEVRDFGRGLDSDKMGRGIGLISMRERAELIGAKVEFLNREPGMLTRLIVPLEGMADAK